MTVLYILYFLLIGLILGSFSNVLIYRIPNKLSIVFPFSFCPICKKKIKWYDNIPVLSYVILGGRCRNCKSKISIQYPLVELVSGIISVLLFIRFGISIYLLENLLMLPVLISVFLIDLKTMYIYDKEVIFLLIIGVLNIVYLSIKNGSVYFSNLISFGIVFSFFILVYLISKLIYKKEVFGFGDVFLASALGLFFKNAYIIPFIMIAVILGAIIGIIIYILAKNKYISFGPFLILSYYLVLFFGDYFNRMFNYL
jgi:leader peptidase (prepilin peptidase)/N-methyltransferase